MADEPSLISLVLPFLGALAGGWLVKRSEIGYDRKKRYFDELRLEYDQLMELVVQCRDTAIKYYSGTITFKSALKIIPTLHEAIETAILIADHHAERAVSFHPATLPLLRRGVRFATDAFAIQRRLKEFHREVTGGDFGQVRIKVKDQGRIIAIRTAFRRLEASVWLHRMNVIRSE